MRNTLWSVLPRLKKVPPTPEQVARGMSGCHLWQGATTDQGYGVISIDGVLQLVHRVVYRLHYGTIRAGYEIDHLCRVRRCGNPEHLEEVTKAVNLERGEQQQRTHCPQGHPYDEKNTAYVGRYRSRRCRACAAARERYRRANR